MRFKQLPESKGLGSFGQLIAIWQCKSLFYLISGALSDFLLLFTRFKISRKLKTCFNSPKFMEIEFWLIRLGLISLERLNFLEFTDFNFGILVFYRPLFWK